MIKVFTTNQSPGNNEAGNNLTEQFEKWSQQLPIKIKVKKIHSNSNKWGWMLVINYEEETNSEGWK